MNTKQKAVQIQIKCRVSQNKIYVMLKNHPIQCIDLQFGNIVKLASW